LWRNSYPWCWAGKTPVLPLFRSKSRADTFPPRPFFPSFMRFLLGSPSSAWFFYLGGMWASRMNANSISIFVFVGFPVAAPLRSLQGILSTREVLVPFLEQQESTMDILTILVTVRFVFGSLFPRPRWNPPHQPPVTPILKRHLLSLILFFCLSL